jgi:hypothetical protein
MTPGQLNRWTLNQWWKVRMLAGWEHRPEPGDDRVAALDLDLVDQGVQRPLAGRCRSALHRDLDLFGEVGQLVAGGRLKVDGIQGGAGFVVADA